MQPYRHAVFHDVFDPAALTRVRDEIINNIEATYKETDIFKVWCILQVVRGGESSTSPELQYNCLLYIWLSTTSKVAAGVMSSPSGFPDGRFGKPGAFGY